MRFSSSQTWSTSEVAGPYWPPEGGRTYQTMFDAEPNGSPAAEEAGDNSGDLKPTTSDPSGFDAGRSSSRVGNSMLSPGGASGRSPSPSGEPAWAGSTREPLGAAWPGDGLAGFLFFALGGRVLSMGICTLVPQRGQNPRLPARKDLTLSLCPLGQKKRMPMASNAAIGVSRSKRVPAVIILPWGPGGHILKGEKGKR
jgi:hypothetical protein